MHNGFVTIDDEKMSKSLGNFFTVRDVSDRFAGEVIRFYLLGTHYRSPINFSDAALQEAEARLKYIYERTPSNFVESLKLDLDSTIMQGHCLRSTCIHTHGWMVRLVCWMKRGGHIVVQFGNLQAC